MVEWIMDVIESAMRGSWDGYGNQGANIIMNETSKAIGMKEWNLYWMPLPYLQIR
jgi:hypothetical protein